MNAAKLTTLRNLVRRLPRWSYVVLVLAALVGFGVQPVKQRIRAASVLAMLARSESAETEENELVEEELLLPGVHGSIRGRLFRLRSTAEGNGIVVAHGVHHRGIDEARLLPFARALARAGMVVLTPELEDLADYRVTEQSIDDLQAAVEWLSAQSGAAGDRVGLLGFSFAGGLALIAATRPALDGKLTFVSSVGGHHDLARVMRFLVTDRIETPGGERATKAHEYGLVVAVYDNVEHFVDGEDVAVVRDTFRYWLREERPLAKSRAQACTTQRCLHMYSLLSTGRLQELREPLLRLLETEATTMRDLSPRGMLEQLDVPVYLLHGSDDSVIPASETRWAAKELAKRPHIALVSPLLTHVEVDRDASLSDQWALLDFVARLL